MARNTQQQKQIETQVDKINRGLQHLGKETLLVTIWDSNYAQMYYTLIDTNEDCVEGTISPRLRYGQLMLWLEAFWKGMVIE